MVPLSRLLAASVLQLGCVLNDGSQDAQKPVQDASACLAHHWPISRGFGFELLPHQPTSAPRPKPDEPRPAGGSASPL